MLAAVLTAMNALQASAAAEKMVLCNSQIRGLDSDSNSKVRQWLVLMRPYDGDQQVHFRSCTYTNTVPQVLALMRVSA